MVLQAGACLKPYSVFYLSLLAENGIPTCVLWLHLQGRGVTASSASRSRTNIKNPRVA